MRFDSRQCKSKITMNMYISLASRDCLHWGLLPPATDAMKKTAKLAKGRFTGDPSYEFEHTEMKKVGELEDATEEEETVSDVIKSVMQLAMF